MLPPRFVRRLIFPPLAILATFAVVTLSPLLMLAALLFVPSRHGRRRALRLLRAAGQPIRAAGRDHSGRDCLLAHHVGAAGRLREHDRRQQQQQRKRATTRRAGDAGLCDGFHDRVPR